MFGDVRCGGTYLLRLFVTTPGEIACGGYCRGRPQRFPSGNYLYVGSALGQRGSTTLARRLLRHATRTGGRPPHALAPALAAALRAAGVANAALPAVKTLRWHIDYLLDAATVNLEAVYVLGDGLALERELAACLALDPQVWVPAPGLGAGDDPGSTHLLGVDGDEAWWQKLGESLAEVAALEPQPQRQEFE